MKSFVVCFVAQTSDLFAFAYPPLFLEAEWGGDVFIWMMDRRRLEGKVCLFLFTSPFHAAAEMTLLWGARGYLLQLR